MSNVLSRKVTVFSVAKFVLPTVLMMMFMSLYSMVDGFFVSRFVGTTALSAVNIVSPIFSFVMALGIMMASGGAAYVATQMGEGKAEQARQNFSLLVIFGVLIGCAFALLIVTFLKPILLFLGANETLYPYCRAYLLGFIFFTPFGILQMMFQSFFVTAGKPSFGLFLIVMGGITNIVLDYIFIVPLNFGVAGAALATGIGFCVPGISGLVYFAIKRKGTLYFVRPFLRIHVLLKSASNGASEMVSNIAVAITTLIFNRMMMLYIGENGVAAITIVLYVEFLLSAMFLGYSSGVAPMISYQNGNKNTGELKKLFKISYTFVAISSAVIFVTAQIVGPYVVAIFTSPGTEVYELAANGFSLFALTYVFFGCNIFTSAFFTALSNGVVSAIISFMRSFVFLITAQLLLPQILGVPGIWLAVPVAELCSVGVSLFFILHMRKIYHYV